MPRKFPRAGGGGATRPGFPRTPEVRKLVLEAGRAFAADDFPATVKFCQEALKRQPDQPEALRLLGALAQKTGSNEVAIGFFTRAIAGDPTLVTAHLGLGDAHEALGQLDAAVASYSRAVVLAPRNADAHTCLAAAYLAAGRREEAIAGFRHAQSADPGDRFSAYMLLGLTGTTGPQQKDYVQGVFDHYAPLFDTHLVGTLRYRMPELIASAVTSLHPERLGAVLDLGCGTGLVADALGSDRAKAIDGVDLSPKMLEMARQKGRYRRLELGELHDVMLRLGVEREAYDVVIAADVFIYVGRLDETFALVRTILQPGGLFLFSVEHSTGDGFELQASSRYAHGEAYIAELARRNSLERLPSTLAPLRQENRRDIPGRLEVLRRGG